MDRLRRDRYGPPVALTVIIRSGDAPSQGLVFDTPRVVIGRGPHCDVMLPDPSVSHRHASIRQRGTDYIVLDEGSTNGTYVGPVRLNEGSPRVLKSGDLLRVGRIWLQIDLAHAIPTPNPAQKTKELALELISSALEAESDPHPHPELIVRAGPDAGLCLPLSRFSAPYGIGRGKSCELTLADEGVSRRHLEVTRRGTHVFVRELGSKNGATLNDAQLEANVEVLWASGAILGVGQTRLELVDPLAGILDQLDRAPDEVVRDSVAPPNPMEGQEEEPPEQLRARTKSRPVRDSLRSPRPTPRPAAAPDRSWGATDILIAVLAVVVLALSFVGLSWLIRG